MKTRSLEELRVMGAGIVRRHLEHGTSLDDGVYASATQDGLSPKEVRLLSQTTNQLMSQVEPGAEFAVVDPELVVSRISEDQFAAEPEQVSDYARSPGENIPQEAVSVSLSVEEIYGIDPDETPDDAPLEKVAAAIEHLGARSSEAAQRAIETELALARAMTDTVEEVCRVYTEEEIPFEGIAQGLELATGSTQLSVELVKQAHRLLQLRGVDVSMEKNASLGRRFQGRRLRFHEDHDLFKVASALPELSQRHLQASARDEVLRNSLRTARAQQASRGRLFDGAA